MNKKQDNLHEFVNKMYILLDEGYERGSLLKDVNELYQEEADEDAFKTDEEMEKAWNAFDKLTELCGTLLDELYPSQE